MPPTMAIRHVPAVDTRPCVAANRNATWAPLTVDLDAFAGQSVRLLIEAADGGPDSLVEAVVDDVRIYQLAP